MEEISIFWGGVEFLVAALSLGRDAEAGHAGNGMSRRHRRLQTADGGDGQQQLHFTSCGGAALLASEFGGTRTVGGA